MAYIDAQPLPFFSHGTGVDVSMLADVIATLYSGNELKHLNIMKKVAMAITGGNLIKAGIHMGCIVKPETPSDLLSEFLPKIGRGEIKLDSGENLYQFGLALLKEI